MNEITNIKELADWIYNNGDVSCPHIDDNSIYFQGTWNSSITIDFETSETIDDIISKTINTLETFDADNEFMELWNTDFAKRNQFKPSQFLKMLQEDEASFKELAGKLEDVWH